MHEPGLNSVFSKASMRRRYEVWFVRLGLAGGSGAWWFRYLLMNLGRAEGGGCPGNPLGQPVQVWATWFPRDGRPQGFIQGFSQAGLSLSPRRASPFSLEVEGNRIGEDSCAGRLELEGHRITWNLRYRSTLGVTLSNVGWIGFSRTPHSDAIFSGEISFDDRRFEGELLGHGVQGHNCGFRHRHLWNWTHCAAPSPSGGGVSSFEALEYELPLGLRFRKALLWHKGKLHTFRKLKTRRRDRESLQWVFTAWNPGDDLSLVAELDGSGPLLHRVPYLKTDCSSTFEVANNSLARATLRLSRAGRLVETIHTDRGAAVEMVGG